MPIHMQINTPCIRQQFSTQNQPLVHELEIFVVRPDVGVLLFFKGVVIVLNLLAAQSDRLLVVGLRVERRIDVDEVDAAAILLQKMRHHLEVVAPVEFVHPAIRLFPVAFLLLRGEVLRGSERTLPRPAKHGLPAYRLEPIAVHHLAVGAGRRPYRDSKFLLLVHLFLLFKPSCHRHDFLV